MRLRRIVVAFAVGGLAFATAAPASAESPRPPAIRSFDACSAADLNGDPRLGPAGLPLFGPVGSELGGYSRTGGHPTRQFIDSWWDPAASFSPFPGIPGNWIFPPSDGYYLRTDGSPVRNTVTLRPGQQIDRFGLPRGSFLSPRGTEYAQRSIPPSNLDDTTRPAGCNYHAYQVLQPFQVYTGAIRPWFDQPGSGRQFQVVCALVPGSTASPLCNQQTGNLQLQYLLDQHLLAEIPVNTSKI
ncbi:conserved exported hypothetical protein [Frankia canadensis]|uniref:TNT domain-containing protein n=1 Tax=Frankia canadensis TaxID=1836972 RepID=A0A2I2KRS9_9ACTN|nr:TNT domain-containing protein [Frankia canadensis]SNQ48374.1 conserved exported hypothetical protein [Frankia canadensis]SOU55664.1 conserved exported hypothetical protein [Frankia canadensis]